MTLTGRGGVDPDEIEVVGKELAWIAEFGGSEERGESKVEGAERLDPGNFHFGEEGSVIYLKKNGESL